MTQSKQLKFAKHIMRLLKVPDVQFNLGRTLKGNLGIRFTESNDQYEIMLDSVALSTESIMTDENNIELKKMMDKYLFDAEPDTILMSAPKEHGETVALHQPVEADDAKRKPGRPKKIIETNP